MPQIECNDSNTDDRHRHFEIAITSKNTYCSNRVASAKRLTGILTYLIQMIPKWDKGYKKTFILSFK